MKLTIGENIRNYRKKNDLTQEEFAERLGVTYQSVSRWENGNTYPDIELLPAIAKVLEITLDELMGMTEEQKETRAIEAFDSLRRECIKKDYDAEKIIEFIRDIRVNYLDSRYYWRPWCEGNDRAFRDPQILPEVRLMAEAVLERYPMFPHVIETMAYCEDEEHLTEFLNKYTTSFDCSQRKVLFNRYFRRGESEKFNEERRYQLYNAMDKILWHGNLLSLNATDEDRCAAEKFTESILSVIRCNTTDDCIDFWVEELLEQGMTATSRLARAGKHAEAISRLEKTVRLLERVMKITSEVTLSTSCRFLDGMVWKAKEHWSPSTNNPDSPLERNIFIYTEMSNMSSCYCIYPSRFIDMLDAMGYDSIRTLPEFTALYNRVKDLVVTKKKS